MGQGIAVKCHVTHAVITGFISELEYVDIAMCKKEMVILQAFICLATLFNFDQHPAASAMLPGSSANRRTISTN